jgi:hypothetical protein
MIDFSLERVITILERTPSVLRELLTGLDAEWLESNEGGDSWNAWAIMGHFVFNEQTDWIPRARIILSGERAFEPFDREGHFRTCDGKSVDQMLTEFSTLRTASLQTLAEWNLQAEDLDRTGIHPEFGEITLRQLLATWAVHDLNHLHQLGRVLGKQLETSIGPWRQYLAIFRDQAQSPLALSLTLTRPVFVAGCSPLTVHRKRTRESGHKKNPARGAGSC